MKNYTGLKTNFLTAKSFAKREKQRTYWFFVCDCGKEIVSRIDYVFQNQKKCCGCKKIPNPKKYQSALNAFYKMYLKSSKKRNYPFELSLNSFEFCVLQNCTYCGVKPSKDYLKMGFLFNGIDRVNNDIGYTLGNSQPCCEMCNKAKRNLSVIVFNDWIERLVNFKIKKNNEI